MILYLPYWMNKLTAHDSVFPKIYDYFYSKQMIVLHWPRSATKMQGISVRMKNQQLAHFCKKMWFNGIYWNKTRSKSFQMITRKTIKISYTHRILFSGHDLLDKLQKRYLFKQVIGSLLDHKFALKSIQVLVLYSSTPSEYSFIRIVYSYSH